MATLAEKQTDLNRLLIIGMGFVCLFLGWLISQTSVFISIGVVLGVAVFLVMLVNTRVGLFILIFSMLFSPELTVAGSAVIRVDDILLIMLLFVWLAKGAILENVGLIHKTPLNMYIAAYVGITFFSTMVAVLDGQAKFLSGFLFVLKYMEYYIIFFMVINQIKNLEDETLPRHLIMAIFLTAFAVSLYAMAHFGGGERISAPFEGERKEPNTLGGYMLIIASLAFGLIQSNISVKHRRYLLVLLGMVFVTILATLSRSTYAALVPTIFMFVLLSKYKNWLVLLLCLSMFAVPFVIPKDVAKRVMYTFTQEQKKHYRQVKVGGVRLDTSTSERVEQWQNVGRDIQNRPLFGYGTTGYSFVDGQYIKVLIDSGVFGLAAFLALMYQIFKHSLKIYREAEDPYMKGTAMGFLCAFVGLLTHALSSNTFIIIRIMMPFCLIMGVVFMIPEFEKFRKEKSLETA